MARPSPRTRSHTRLPFTVFAIPFGLSGIAGTWTIAGAALGVPDAIGLTLWAIAGAAWLGVLAAYTLRALRTSGSLLADLRDPSLGPFGALAPVVAILLGGAIARVWPPAAAVLVGGGVILTGLLSAWLLAEWMVGSVGGRVFHPGNFLTVLAGGLIGAIGLAQIGARGPATVAFCVGVFFWAVLAAVVLARLTAIESLPAAIIPTLVIFSVPPSVAGIAWFAIGGDRIDWIQQTLLGLMIFLLLSQVFLVRFYARVPFGLGYWAFTFSVAAPATYGIHWLWLTRPSGWLVWSWLILLAVTAWIGWIAARSGLDALRRLARR